MPLIFRIFIFSIVLFWYAGIYVEFFSRYFNKFLFFVPFLNLMYSNVCHQVPAKEIYFNGMHTLVCARCVGIYTGVLVVAFGVLFFKELKKGPRILLLLAFAPVALDVAFANLGLYSYSKIFAIITGFILGSIVFYYFYEAISTKYWNSK